LSKQETDFYANMYKKLEASLNLGQQSSSQIINQLSLPSDDDINEEILNRKIFPITLGGEHSITPGCIEPFAKKYNKVCLLHFDAHADLRESYNGEKFSHASAIKRCLDYKNVSVISFGIRNISKSEVPYLKKNSSRISIFWAKDKSKWNFNKFIKLIKNKTVYLTFDVDGLDSSIMPATGTPEPGGLLWEETLKIIKLAAKNSNIVGADINELAPIKGFDSYNFLVAKLAYKIISYSFEFGKKSKY
jgi:agmatinase